MNKTIKFADFFGLAASGLCLIHCVATPFMYALLPLIGFGFEEDLLHRVMVILIVLPIFFALVPGFFKHGRKFSLVIGILGALYFCVGVLVIGSRYGETAEIMFTIIGGIHLIIAHYKNRTFCKNCEICASAR